MRQFPLILILACIGCAGGLTGRAEFRAPISAKLAEEQTCIRLPNDGEWTIARGERVSIRGFPRPGGGFAFPDRPGTQDETIRATYDLLAELGLYSVVEEPVRGPPEGRIRRYQATPLGEAHIETVPGGHGVGGWDGLCYGERRLIAIEEVGPLIKAPCRVSRPVSYTYHYVGIPAWADDPRLRRFFPDMIGSAEAATPRRGFDSLKRHDDHWYVEARGYYFIPCVSEDKKEDPFRTG